MENLQEKYGISQADVFLCRLVRALKKNNTCPSFIYKRSRKKYGWRDSLARYYIEKYQGVPIGEKSYGYRGFGVDFLKQIGGYCSIAEGTTSVHGNHHMEFVTTSPILTLAELRFCPRIIKRNLIFIL